jgi:hypothetical protein
MNFWLLALLPGSIEASSRTNQKEKAKTLSQPHLVSPKIKLTWYFSHPIHLT